MSSVAPIQSNKRKASPKKKDSPKRMRRERVEAIRFGMEDAEDDEGRTAVTMLKGPVSQVRTVIVNT